ncbi:putative RNase H-like nuclease [Catalinimonas alkaloidigena]|uniref:DUF429 domain-containing protein n=1 Tax=Catalinimonas alkaloidigena TaxID=1075417 RepID=UPI002405E165|nr:DUF429 domain-containing protein [Catalinimonas alkaloidigena]MDF9800540.1 putative RNase H-like nuclease [Catalinimonas alkaloidigena]
MPEFILGIDAAWTVGGSSGLALLKKENTESPSLIKLAASYKEFVGEKTYTNQKALPDLHQVINEIGKIPHVVALDIPLSPRPMTTYRAADRQITSRYGKKGAAVHSPTHDRPGKVADHMFAQLSNAGLKWAGVDAIPENAPYFMEVYPHVSIIEYMQLEYRLPYKVQKKGKYWKEYPQEERYHLSIKQLLKLRAALQLKLNHSLDDYLPVLDQEQKYKTSFLKAYEDQLDAIVCALTGYDFLQGKAMALGDETSAIWIPNSI